MVKYVPNYDFLCIEDVNTIILNNGVHFQEDYDIDTRLLEDDATKTYENYRFDFILISKQKYGNEYEYILEIRNSLWDGSYSFIESSIPSEQIEVTQVLSSPNVLKIRGTELEYFILRLHLTNEEDARNIQSNRMKVAGIENIVTPYKTEYSNELFISDLFDSPIANATVTLNINDETATTTTGANGKCMIPYVELIPGNYTGILTISKNGYATLKKPVKIRVLKTDFMMDFTRDPLYKGGICELAITIFSEVVGGDLNAMEGQYIIVKTPNDTLYVDADEVILADIYISKTFKFNLRGYYEDYYPVTVIFEESTFFNRFEKDFALKTEWYIAKNYQELEEACEDKDGPDTIRILNSGDYTYVGDDRDMIEITRPIEIQGENTDNGWSVLNGNGRGYFVVTNTTFTLNGVQCNNCDPVIYQNEGSYVRLMNSLFTYNTNNNRRNKGTVVACDITNRCKDNKKLFETFVKNSQFFNNEGSCFHHGGQLTIIESQFLKTHTQYLNFNEPYVATLVYGDCGVYDSQFDIDTEEEVSAENLSFMKTAFFVGETASLNGKIGKELNADNSLNFFDYPYSNESHIFVKYHYPLIDGNPVLIASPEPNKETRSIGHSVENGEWNYAYKDGHQLTRAEWGKENTVRQLNIELKDHGGVW